jgi:hypothetical protein
MLSTVMMIVRVLVGMAFLAAGCSSVDETSLPDPVTTSARAPETSSTTTSAPELAPPQPFVIDNTCSDVLEAALQDAMEIEVTSAPTVNLVTSRPIDCRYDFTVLGQFSSFAVREYQDETRSEFQQFVLTDCNDQFRECELADTPSGSLLASSYYDGRGAGCAAIFTSPSFPGSVLAFSANAGGSVLREILPLCETGAAVVQGLIADEVIIPAD